MLVFLVGLVEVLLFVGDGVLVFDFFVLLLLLVLFCFFVIVFLLVCLLLSYDVCVMVMRVMISRSSLKRCVECIVLVMEGCGDVVM